MGQVSGQRMRWILVSGQTKERLGESIDFSSRSREKGVASLIIYPNPAREKNSICERLATHRLSGGKLNLSFGG